MDPQQNPAPMTVEKKSFGPIIGIVVILVVIILGGLYFWGGMMSESNGTATEKMQAGQVDAGQQNIVAPATDASDINELEADFNADASDTAVDFSDLDSSLGQ